MIRTFIAIDFPAEIITKIARITAYLRTQTPVNALNWVAPENMHLTLNFLGDVREDHILAIEQCLQEAVRGQSSFNITIEGLGMYPNAKQPRVVWLGIKDAGALKHIQQALTKALKVIDIEQENRPFLPHLTLARIRRNSSPDLTRQVGETLSQFKVDSLGSFPVQSVHLFKSELTPKGTIYTSLFSTPLNQV
jgi:2'-5' RNA ligase